MSVEIAADDHRGTRDISRADKNLEMLQHRAHLVASTMRSADNIQMRVPNRDLTTVDFHIEKDSDPTSDPFLFALEVVLASGKSDYLGISERVPCHYRVAVQSVGVLAGKIGFSACAFCELEILDPKNCMRL
jgi:hypothetical protein